MSYSLAQYYRDAGIFDYPDIFYSVQLRFKPYPEQVADLKHCYTYERFALYNDAGVGKTLPMLALLLLYTTGYGNKGVLVMPPALIGQVLESLYDEARGYFIGLKSVANVQPYTGKKAEKELLMKQWAKSFPDAVLMSYSAFSNLHPTKKVPSKVIVNAKTGNKYLREEVKPLRHHPLKTLGVNVLLFDEAQALKNPSSGISKKLWRYIGETKGEYLLGLITGSPIPNTLVDALGHIKLKTPWIYKTQRQFDDNHVVLNQNSIYRQILGFKNVDKLHDILYTNARRTTKNEVIKDLPEMVPKLIDVSLAPKHIAQYKKLLTERVLELESEFIDATQQQKLRQVALQLISTPELYMDGKVENNLLNALCDEIAHVNPFQNKIIVFAHFRETISFLAKHFSQLNPAIINGSSGDKEKSRSKFVSDDSCRILLANYKSGGAGLNLQVCHHTYFYETPTVPQDALQAIARTHRGGQTETVNAVFFKVAKTLSCKSLKQLLDKDAQANTVVKDSHKMLHELLGV